MFGTNTAPKNNPHGDYECPNPPTDCISSLTWSPKGTTIGKTLLCCTAWDGSVRVWDIQKEQKAPPIKCQATAGPSHKHDAPVLCSSIAPDGRIFSGGCDKMVKVWDLNSGQQPQQVAQHSEPVKGCYWSEDAKLLITGGWDNCVKFWDLRSANPVGEVKLNGPFVAMDCTTYPMATFLEPRKIVLFDLNQKKELSRMDPHNTMKEHLRCVANFPNINTPGFGCGSIEGRVCIMHMNEAPDKKNFSFRCHRENQADIYPVHSLSFHPTGVFATTGGNGAYTFWDKESKQRIKHYGTINQPVSCGGFDSDGFLFAYAVSYDWSKGAEGFNPQAGSHVQIHSVSEADIKPKPRSTRR